MRYIVAFSVIFSFLFFSGVAESNENRYQKIEFSNENNFFETLSEALSTDLSTKEIQKAIKVFKVKQEVKNFKDAKSLIDAQPTSAKTLISNVRRLNLETNISELNLLKSHIFDVAKVNAGQSSVTKIPVAAVAVLPALAVLSGSGSSLPTLSVNDVATSDEAAGDATFTVTLSEASDDTVTVSYKTSNGTATSGADYTAVSATTLSFEPGVTSMEFTVAVLADSLDEANETVTLTLSSASNATILDATGNLTITDDDAAPTIDFNATSSTGAESVSSKSITVDLSVVSGKSISVNYALTGTATGSATDYTLAGGTLTIAAGSTSGTITIASIVNDTMDEVDETVIVTLSNASNATLGSDTVHTYTITDNDAAPSLSINDLSTLNEVASNATMTVTLSAASGKTVTVSYATSNGTATAGSDYTAISATTMTFSPGDTTKTFTVGILADTTEENNETVILTLSSASNAVIFDAIGTLTITDDDRPSLSINNVTTSNENAANATFTVTMSPASSNTVTVSYATSNGTATAGADYTAVSATTLTFSAGETSKTFNVAVLADSLDEANETVTLTLSSASNATISDATGTLTITDDDATPSLSINDVTTSNENAANATFTVTLSAASSRIVTVSYATSNGTATAGSDYTAVSATTLTFSPGDTSKTFNVAVLADAIDEANETVTLTLSSASNATISDATGTLTITDDDATPSLSINDVTTSNENAANATFTVTLSAASGQTVSVSYATSNGTATAGSDYTAVSATTLTFSPGDTSKTFNVAVLADAIDEANETVTLTLSSASNATISDATGTLTITDDDATPSLSINDVTKAEAVGSSTTATFTVTLSAASGQTVSVSYATSNGTATAGSDYTAVSATTLTFSPGQTSKTFNVAVLADTIYETSEAATLTLSSASNATISDATGTLTITDKFLNSGTPETYNSSLASAWAALGEYTNIEYFDPNKGTNPSPWESINLNKAFGYGKYGAGVQVAIVDGGFYFTETGASTTHSDLDGKTVTTFGQFNAPAYVDTGCSGSDGNNSHGTCVAGIIGADYDGGGIVGVAPGVSFHLTDWKNTVGFTDMFDKLAKATDDASSAVAQNNSWGGSWDATEFQALINANPSWTKEALWAYTAGSAGTTTTVTAYKNALNDFQSHGVIVFANGNDTDETSAALESSLPIWFTELDEAWITVANIDITGTSTKTYTQKGNPCGLAGSFCLATDGWYITAPSYVAGDGGSWYSRTQGTSFSAPTVSGAVALMADHFPNQTPAQWADRLFASADNAIGYTHVGQVTFGNGVQHGYSNEAGHGILDIYAALQPITSDSYVTQVSGGNISLGGDGSYAFNETFILSAASFGDSIAEALKGEFTYMYDALDGGFKFDMAQTIKSLAGSNSQMSIDHELGQTDLSKNRKLRILNAFSGSTSDGSFSLSGSQSNSSLANFTSNGLWAGYDNPSYMFPFLSSLQGGPGLNYGDNLGDGYLTFSYNSEKNDTVQELAKDALTFNYEMKPTESLNVNYIGGLVNEGENFLGAKGSGAFDFSGSNNKTAFLGLKSNIKLTKNYFFNAGLGFSETSVNKTDNGIVQNISGVSANSFEVGITSLDTFGSDVLSLSVSQPSRVYNGVVDLRIAGLANTDESIPYTYKRASLEPSGRQLDFALSYNYDLTQTSNLRVKLKMTKDKGHDTEARKEGSIYLGYSKLNRAGTNKLTMGVLTNANRSTTETALKLGYTVGW